jgi:hypothetical protein
LVAFLEAGFLGSLFGGKEAAHRIQQIALAFPTTF